MKREIETQWERELDARLKQLPEVEAPANLLANVMGAIEKRQTLAWYRRPYYTWSDSMKLGGGFALVLVGVLFAFGSYYGMNAASISTEIEGLGQWFASLFEVMDGLRRSIVAIGRTVLGQYALALLLVASLVYGSIFGTGAFVYKILRQRTGGEHVG